MGFLFALFAVAIFIVIFAILTSALTIWFRNKAMRIISLIFTIAAFIVYLILVFTIGSADKIFGISAEKLLFFPVAIPMYLQCYFTMQSASSIFAKKILFSAACLIIVRLLNMAIGAAADVLYENSLDEFAQLLWKVNSYVFYPLLFTGISYVFAMLFHPHLKVFKQLVLSSLVVLVVISICDELLTMSLIYAKFRDFFVHDWYTYLLIFVISVFQIGVGCLLGSYIFKNKHDSFSV
ncbi:MAG: hypothetical protein EON51_13425 [Acinetobacter sp.]|nr:MAG: hypothetical protein EON51_13425 [Acinetobacter sp.]